MPDAFEEEPPPEEAPPEDLHEQQEDDDPILGLLSAHQEQITAVTQQVGNHEEALEWVLEELGAGGKKPKAKPVAWSWRHATGGQRQALWNELHGFVEWVNSRYFAREYTGGIAPCWYRHPKAVEELTAMWAAWHAAYHDHRKPSPDAADWHNRTLWPGMERLEAEFRSCNDEKQHSDIVGRDWSTDDGFDAYVGADVEEHAGEEQSDAADAG